MNKKDISDLFELLEIYFSGHQKLKVKGQKEAWLAVLEPYSRENVKTALMSFLREKPGFPTPQEIALRCPTIKTETPKDVFPRNGPLDCRAKEAQDRLFARMRAERERLLPLRRAAGIPATMEEAKSAGMTSMEWISALEDARLNYTDRVWHEGGVKDGSP